MRNNYPPKAWYFKGFISFIALGVYFSLYTATGIPQDALVSSFVSFASALWGGKTPAVSGKAAVSEVSKHGSNMTSENVSSSGRLNTH